MQETIENGYTTSYFPLSPFFIAKLNSFLNTFHLNHYWFHFLNNKKKIAKGIKFLNVVFCLFLIKKNQFIEVSLFVAAILLKMEWDLSRDYDIEFCREE